MRITRKRVLAVAMVLLGASLIIASAAHLGSGRTRRGATPLEGDEVLIYQNGFSQVFQSVKAHVRDGICLLEMPSGAFLDTLRVSGAKVLQIDTYTVALPLETGDDVVVETLKNKYSGRLVSHGAQIVLDTNNGTVMIEANQVVAIHILNAAAPTPGVVRVKLLVDERDGTFNLSLSYVMRGLSWHATHRIDVDRERIQTWVGLTSSHDLSTKKLKIVSGAPRFVMSSPEPGWAVERMSYSAGLSMDSAASSWTSSSLDEYHEYTLNRALLIGAGHEIRLPLFDEPIELRHEYVLHASTYGPNGRVQHEWEFTNTLRDPLPSGVTTLYRDGRLIGQDNLPYLPREEKGRVVSGDALDLPAKGDSNDRGRSCGPEFSRQFTITVTNRKTESVEVRVIVSLDDWMDVSSTSPAPTASDEERIEWVVRLTPSQAQTVSAGLIREPGSYAPDWERFC